MQEVHICKSVEAKLLADYIIVTVSAVHFIFAFTPVSAGMKGGAWRRVGIDRFSTYLSSLKKSRFGLVFS